VVPRGPRRQFNELPELGWSKTPKRVVGIDRNGWSESTETAGRIGPKRALGEAFNRIRQFSDQVLIVKQVEGVVELLVGGSRSESYGSVLTVGLGGLLAEAIREVGFLIGPIDLVAFTDLMERHPSLDRILRSRRRGRGLAWKRLLPILQACDALLATVPEVATIQFNPVILNEDGAWIADAKIIVSTPGVST
jgi:hypothetical protein